MAVTLITGCSRGIGLHSALTFARQGHRVYAGVRDLSTSEPLEAALNKEPDLDVKMVQLDMCKPESFTETVNSIIKEAGSLKVLVNNAGVIQAGAAEDLNESDIRRVMETNFFGPMLLSRAVLQQMRAQRRGKIIMVSSLSGVAGLAGDVFYSGSKFALEGATEALRHEVSRWGIHVALIEAASYATNLFDASIAQDGLLPEDYPKDSPYRALIENRQRAQRESNEAALDPAAMAEHILHVAQSDGAQLRHPADELSKQILQTVFRQSDQERDKFLRDAADMDWWIQGKDSPDSTET